MSTRGSFRGRGLASRGISNFDPSQPRGGSTRGGYGSRGARDSSSAYGSHGGAEGGSSSGHLHHQQQQQEKRTRESILDLSKYLDKGIMVKFSGGREVTGILKGYDQLMNLVLDDVKETLRDEENIEHTRELGLVVARGPMLTLIAPVDGSEQIENPFLNTEE